MPQIKLNELKPKVVLGIVAHPDDLDFAAAGTFVKWAMLGTKIYYLILTDGCKGSAQRHLSTSDLITLRQKEQKQAGKILGIKKVFFCGYEDGSLENNQDVKRVVVSYIRKIKPDIVVTFDPTMVYVADSGFINHPDHRAAGQAALDGVFPLARDRLSFPELLAEGLKPHITPTVLLANFNNQNYFEDITKTIDKKMDSLAVHKSQIANMEATQNMIRNIAVQTGKLCGHKYAEGFVRIDIM